MHVRTTLSASLVLGSLVIASPLRAETLEDALVAAYTGNAALLAQRAQLRATDELVPEAKANWRPVVTVTGDAGVDQIGTNTLPSTLNRDQTLFARDASLSIVQPLYRGGRTDAQIAQAEATVKAGRQQLAATEQGVLLGAITAYLDVIQDAAVVDLNKNNEQVLQRQLDATNDRFRVGEVTRTDVAQAEAALSGAHASRRAAEGVLQDAIATYTRVVGHPPKGLEAAPTPADLPASADAARDASESNPSVQAQRFAYEAAMKAVDVAEGALLPTVSLKGSYGRTLEESYTGTYSSSAAALVNITIPIYQQGAEYAVVRQQKHTAGQQKLQLDEIRRETVEATTQAWENLQSARARVQSLEDQVRASRVALEGIQRESLVGSRTVLDVLTTEQQLLQARVNLEIARHDAVLAAYQLKSEIGQLTGQALHLSAPIYDPKAHYDEVTDKWIGTGVTPTYGEMK
jgi:outer membrane protein